LLWCGIKPVSTDLPRLIPNGFVRGGSWSLSSSESFDKLRIMAACPVKLPAVVLRDRQDHLFLLVR